MEGSVPCYTLGSQELSSNIESVTIPDSSGDISMNDLKMCLKEISVGDVESSASGLLAENNSKCDLVMEYDCNASYESSDNLLESTSSVEGLLSGEKGREGHKTSEANACDKSVDQCHSAPATRPKLKSAMKGSREKQGIPPTKLSVTWAPDVYDPIPTSVSHVPSSRNQYRNNSRKWKNKQKGGGGKSSRGGKGKKQARKNAAAAASTTTATKFKPIQDDSMASFSEPEASILDFNVVSTDPFCGSSFLKESIQNLHFPVAEATR